MKHVNGRLTNFPFVCVARTDMNGHHKEATGLVQVDSTRRCSTIATLGSVICLMEDLTFGFMFEWASGQRNGSKPTNEDLEDLFRRNLLSPKKMPALRVLNSPLLRLLTFSQTPLLDSSLTLC